MKNQPNGPGCFLAGVFLLCMIGAVKFSRLPAPIGVGSDGIAFGWLVLGLGATMLLIAGVVVVSRLDTSGEIEQSGDIVTMTWTLANHVGMDNAQNLREQVAELKYPETNNGIWRWKPGHSLQSFQGLALANYGVACPLPLTADELLQEGEG